MISNPANYKEAWRATFTAAEGLFRLMFQNSPRLTAGEVDARLRPAIRIRYADDQTGLRAAEKILDSLKDWIDASHNYRHEPGEEEPAQPPPELAIFAISNGASFLRWLVDVDQDLARGG